MLGETDHRINMERTVRVFNVHSVRVLNVIDNAYLRTFSLEVDGVLMTGTLALYIREEEHKDNHRGKYILKLSNKLLFKAKDYREIRRQILYGVNAKIKSLYPGIFR